MGDLARLVAAIKEHLPPHKHQPRLYEAPVSIAELLASRRDYTLQTLDRCLDELLQIDKMQQELQDLQDSVQQVPVP